jgi:SAM-dependent methyltransferase
MKSSFGSTGGKPRLLVTIASYGEKNLGFLKTIIQNYRNMPLEVEVVVVSDAPKNLGHGAKVVVGLPSRNPWSLPFAHKAILAENVERFDLFVYSEDDIEVTREHLEAFQRSTMALKPDEIAGYLRYEIGTDGTKFLPDAHATAHWKPESVQRRGDYTTAEFTNVHAGFYILTQSQLKQAIASGGFLRTPCQGQYGLPETAATDPYTNCGFRKVICISVLDDFLLWHMSNAYVNVYRVSLDSCKGQIQTLMGIRDGVHPVSSLCEIESKLLHGRWSKSYYEVPSEALLRMIPKDALSILSIGCGWGDTEARLKERGAAVTALPLDSVIGAVAARRGMEVIHGSWEQCLKVLDDRRFECVLMTNLLHLQPDPGDVLRQCARFVQAGGTLVLSGPNFDRVPWLVKRVCGAGQFRNLRSFELSGISVCGPGTLAGAIRNAGLRVSATHWLNHSLKGGRLRGTRIPLGKLTARDWLMQARR